MKDLESKYPMRKKSRAKRERRLLAAQAEQLLGIDEDVGLSLGDLVPAVVQLETRVGPGLLATSKLIPCYLLRSLNDLRSLRKKTFKRVDKILALSRHELHITPTRSGIGLNSSMASAPDHIVRTADQSFG